MFKWQRNKVRLNQCGGFDPAERAFGDLFKFIGLDSTRAFHGVPLLGVVV